MSSIDFLERTRLLVGEQAMEDIKNTTVAIVGLGGVGGAACEAVARSGVSNIILLDNDKVDLSNLNRQIITDSNNIGMLKCDVAKKRVLSINPQADVTTLDCFLLEDTKEQLFSLNPNYIIDAIDTMSAKISLAKTALERGVKLISSLATGNRFDPTKFKIGDISDTIGSGCPMARVLRKELRKRDVTSLKVVYSTEVATKIIASSQNGRHSPASISFVPPVAGYLLASYVINDIINQSKTID